MEDNPCRFRSRKLHLALTHNGDGLAMWQYSVLRQPELLLSKDMKMKIYSITGLYSEVGYIAE